MSHGHTAAEQAGRDIGLKVVEQARRVSEDEAEVHRLFTAGLVLCAGESSPEEAVVGFAAAVVPALQEAPVSEKALATLAARAALAGHTCTRDSDGRLTLARWGHSRIFDRLEEAEAWLQRVTGKGAL